MPSLRSCFSGVRPPAVALVPAVVAFGIASGPATAKASGASANLATSDANPQRLVEVGMPTTFTVTVTNDGQSTANNVTVTDTWPNTPSGFGGISVTGPVPVSCITPPVTRMLIYGAQRVVTCSTSSLPSGQSVVIHLTLICAGITGHGVLIDGATATSTNSASSGASASIYWI